MRIKFIAVIALAIIFGTAPAALAAGTGTSGPLSTVPSLLTTGSAGTTTPSSGGQASTGPVTVPAPTSTTTSSGGISTGEAAGLGVAVLLVLVGIGRYIVSDARRHRPSRASREMDRTRGSVKPVEHRIRDSRAKAKRARRARRAGR